MVNLNVSEFSVTYSTHCLSLLKYSGPLYFHPPIDWAALLKFQSHHSTRFYRSLTCETHCATVDPNDEDRIVPNPAGDFVDG